jgi:glyoxylase-like metal-dependent hydrolase (beta-lactamase superfamily II)
MRVEQLHCGTVVGPPGYFFRDAARGRIPLAQVLGLGVPREAFLTLPVGAFLVEHPTEGPFLIDAGFHPDAVNDPQAEFGRLGARIFAGLDTTLEQTVPAQLRARGIDPDDIGLVVMTHLHPDHASGLRQFPRARVVCSAAEWSAATGRSAPLGGYIAGHMPEQSQVEQIAFRSDGSADGPFASVVDLFRDGSVKLISTRGHTAGHLSVLLETADEPTLVLGDAVYTLDALDGPRPPFRNADEKAWHSSVAQIADYASRNPGARLIPTHDPDAWVDQAQVAAQA